MKSFRLRVPALAAAAVLLSAPTPLTAAVVSADFASDPLQQGWNVFGDTNLFHWNSARGQLDVTWDSTRPNSYFYHPLPWNLTRFDDFQIEFDLVLSNIVSGVEPGKTGPMQLAVGFLNLAGATSAQFMRGSYGSAPNVAEFDYYTEGYYKDSETIYPAPATATPSFISGVNSFDYAPSILSVYEIVLSTQQVVHVTLAYTAISQTAALSIRTNGVPAAALPPLVLDPAHGFADDDDFDVDVFSISSYSSAGDPFDSLRAHGAVSNVVVTLPEPVRNLAGGWQNGVWQAWFDGRTNWMFTLERSTNGAAWSAVSASVPGTAGAMVLSDTNLSLPERALYRVGARRP
ncbi:MAG: hypothetical protein U1F98_06440 [Verrucomicrobiota bacterium]